MATSHVSTRTPGKTSALSAGIAALLGLASPSAMAVQPSTVYVDTCAEGTTNTDPTHGSLRWAVSNVTDGGTVDATGLGCSTISLQSGAIDIAQNDLTILGPGKSALNVSSAYNNTLSHTRVFNHTGTGQLGLQDLEVSNGYYKSSAGTAKGGCVFSNGSVYLKNVYVTTCQALTDSSLAAGGAVYAAGSVQLQGSTVSNSTANGGASGFANGGGIYAHGISTLDAMISHNTATDGGSIQSSGGGIFVKGSGTLINSTVSGNYAIRSSGGISAGDFPTPPPSFTLQNSTVSGNTSGMIVGGIYSNASTVTLENSTIAFNTAATKLISPQFPFYVSPGFAGSSYFGAQYINLQGSILSNNVFGGSTEWDISAIDYTFVTTFNPGPAHNLVRATSLANCSAPTQPTGVSLAVATNCLPYDTIRNQCPLLGSLRNNGGPTPTHALLSGSPAIDTGTNPLTLAYDQRGTGYARVSNLLADIGAYEVQQDDIVFNTEFEGCPTLSP